MPPPVAAFQPNGEAEKVQPLVDSETDLPQQALINNACTVTSD